MDTTDLLRNIARGNYHSNGLLCQRLFQLAPPFFSELQNEIRTFISTHLASDVTSRDHVTHWTKPFGVANQLSLLNSHGRTFDTSEDHNLSVKNKKFHFASSYPLIAQFISFFPHAINMRLNILRSKSGLSPHEEHIVHWNPKTKKWFLRVRFHLPVFTTPQAVMLLEKNLYHFDEGWIYFFNNGAVHSAENPSEDIRIHLVWDMLLTDMTKRLMFDRPSELPPDIFKSCPKEQSILAPLKRIDVPYFEPSGPGPELYRRLGLNKVGIDPCQFQRVYNFFDGLIPKRIRLADEQ